MKFISFTLSLACQLEAYLGLLNVWVPFVTPVHPLHLRAQVESPSDIYEFIKSNPSLLFYILLLNSA
jgi:hypothetical protein